MKYVKVEASNCITPKASESDIEENIINLCSTRRNLILTRNSLYTKINSITSKEIIPYTYNKVFKRMVNEGYLNFQGGGEYRFSQHGNYPE